MFSSTPTATRVHDIAGRPGTLLANGLVRLHIDDFGGMTPELSFPNGSGRINTHFVPRFRGSEAAFDPARHAAWGGPIGYNLAGNFPCFPCFGNPSTARGYEIPACGHTAQMRWTVRSCKADSGMAHLHSVLGGGPETAGIAYERHDILLAGHPVHYQVITLENRRAEPFRYGGAWHNTTGQPFIEAGCRISACADRYHTPPVSHDPAQVERLALDREFTSLKAAPGKDGSKVDISLVPGIIGTTDFITGRIPPNAPLGWMAIVNPRQNALYMPFFKGPAAVGPDEFTFLFNHLWMQYGGRHFPPFARCEGGADQELAVGVESAISAWGYGLDYSDKHPILMGNPTSLVLQPGERKTLFQGTLVARIGNSALDEGVTSANNANGHLHVVGERGEITTFNADAGFERIRSIAIGNVP